MRTIGTQWPESRRGDRQAQCDICKVVWYRSQLTRKADGLLYCPDDVDGRDAVTLSVGNAEGSRRRGRRPNTGGSLYKDPVEPTPPLPPWILNERTF